MKKFLAMLLTLMLCMMLFAGCKTATPQSVPAPEAAVEAPATDTGAESPAEEAAEEDNAVAVDKWIIPVIGVESGSAAGNGKQATYGAHYAAEVINTKGGIRGVPVEVVVYDTAMDTSKAITAMAELVDSSLIVLGPWDSPSVDAVAELAFESGLPFIGASSKSEYAPYNLAYMAESAEVSASAICMWLEENPDIKKLCIFYIPSDTNQVASHEACCAAANAMGVEVVASVEITAGQIDLGPVAVKALSSGADGYYAISRVDEYSLLVKEMRNRGFADGAKMCSDFATFNSSLLDLDADLLNGLYISNKIDPEYTGEAWQAFREAYAGQFSGAYPTSASSAGYYDSVMAIAAAIETLELTGDIAKLQQERDALATYLYTSPTMDGCQGDFGWTNGQVQSSAKLFQFNAEGKYLRVK